MVAMLSSYIQTFDSPPCQRTTQPAERVEDPAIALAAAEERGYLRGLAEAEHIRAAERRAENAHFESSLSESRSLWAEEEGRRLADLLTAALDRRRDELADDMAAILVNFVGDAIRERAVGALRTTIIGLLSDDWTGGITLTGPADLLQRLAEGLGESTKMIRFVTADAVDVRVLAGSTVIETRISAWMQRLATPSVQG